MAHLLLLMLFAFQNLLSKSTFAVEDNNDDTAS